MFQSAGYFAGMFARESVGEDERLRARMIPFWNATRDDLRRGHTSSRSSSDCSEYTCLEYAHPLAQIVFTDGGDKKVVAETPIPKHSIICVERVIGGTKQQLVTLVGKCNILSGSLFPRTEEASAEEKVSLNSFAITTNMFMLGKYISSFNHHDDPNAISQFYSQPVDFGEPGGIIRHVPFGCIWTQRDIAQHEELCISYRSSPSDEHQYVSNQAASPIKCAPEHVDNLFHRIAERSLRQSQAATITFANQIVDLF